MWCRPHRAPFATIVVCLAFTLLLARSLAAESPDAATTPYQLPTALERKAIDACILAMRPDGQGIDLHQNRSAASKARQSYRGTGLVGAGPLGKES